MNYFKDNNDEIYAFDDDEVSRGYGSTLTPIVHSDIAQIINDGKTVDMIVSEKLAELEMSYEAEIYSDIAYMSTTFQADKSSQELITKCLVAGSVPANFAWRDNAQPNNMVPMIFAELQGLAGTILERGNVAFVKRIQLREQVKACTTKPEIQAIVW